MLYNTIIIIIIIVIIIIKVVNQLKLAAMTEHLLETDMQNATIVQH